MKVYPLPISAWENQRVNNKGTGLMIGAVKYSA